MTLFEKVDAIRIVLFFLNFFVQVKVACIPIIPLSLSKKQLWPNALLDPKFFFIKYVVGFTNYRRVSFPMQILSGSRAFACFFTRINTCDTFDHMKLKKSLQNSSKTSGGCHLRFATELNCCFPISIVNLIFFQRPDILTSRQSVLFRNCMILYLNRIIGSLILDPGFLGNRQA